MYYDCTSNAEKNEVVRFFPATDGFSRFCPFLLPPKEVNWFYLKQIAACCCLDSGLTDRHLAVRKLCLCCRFLRSWPAEAVQDPDIGR